MPVIAFGGAGLGADGLLESFVMTEELTGYIHSISFCGSVFRL